MRRVVSLWLPQFATDRLQRQRRLADCFALSESLHGRLQLAAVSPAAAAAGIFPGQPLAEARAILPDLATFPHEPAADAAALETLALWCGRYTPLVAIDRGGPEPGGAAGLFLDIAGCAHLFGGEEALLSDFLERLRGFGFVARAALAETPAAAWALARFAASAEALRCSPKQGGLHAALSPLPVEALRLDPASVEALRRFGLRSIGALYDLPPAGISARLGGKVVRRLRLALGEIAEPISPLRPPAPHRFLRSFAEPLSRVESLARVLDDLLEALCRSLAERQEGARQLHLACYRVDGGTAELRIGTSRPSRTPAHLARLFRDRLAGIDPGFGIEAMTLAAEVVETLDAQQYGLAGGRAGDGEAVLDLPALVDRLAGRLGFTRVRALAPQESHLPERAQRAVLPFDPALRASWRSTPPRPLRLFSPPEEVEVPSEQPDLPPTAFRWRHLLHNIVCAEGPERVMPEWWHGDAAPKIEEARDYYRVEDEDGRRYWLYRSQRADETSRWYLHGLFA